MESAAVHLSMVTGGRVVVRSIYIYNDDSGPNLMVTSLLIFHWHHPVASVVYI